MNWVNEAISELNVAVMQSGPEDDRIIMGRVRNALKFLEQEQREVAIRTPSSPERLAFIAEAKQGKKDYPAGASVPGRVAPGAKPWVSTHDRKDADDARDQVTA